MGQSLVVSGGNADAEELGDRRQIFFRGRGEVPVTKGLLCIAASIGPPVAAKHLRGVVGRIEADT